MGFALKDILKKRGLTAYRLSQLVDGRLERSSVYRLVSGKKVKLSSDEVAALCEALRVTPNELFGHKRGKA